MKLIGLSGNKRVGKDTVARIISEEYYATTCALADEIKRVLMVAFTRLKIDITYDQINGIDYDRESHLNISKEQFENILITAYEVIIENGYPDAINAWKEVCDVILEKNKIENYSIRRLMQILGTDIAVNHIDKNIWVNYIDKKFNETFTEYFVITDLRQEHEFEYIKQNMGKIIHINRGHDSETSIDNHITERNLGMIWYDNILNNTGTISELKNQVTKIIGDYNVK